MLDSSFLEEYKLELIEDLTNFLNKTIVKFILHSDPYQSLKTFPVEIQAKKTTDLLQGFLNELSLNLPTQKKFSNNSTSSYIFEDFFYNLVIRYDCSKNNELYLITPFGEIPITFLFTNNKKEQINKEYLKAFKYEKASGYKICSSSRAEETNCGEMLLSILSDYFTINNRDLYNIHFQNEKELYKTQSELYFINSDDSTFLYLKKIKTIKLPAEISLEEIWEAALKETLIFSPFKSRRIKTSDTLIPAHVVSPPIVCYRTFVKSSEAITDNEFHPGSPPKSPNIYKQILPREI
ncbi:MAG: hypothetical protein J0H68_04660 [Sphingobacteriia bacterium]|nr:hypothetical protein [Sphingobacteriia bacterium]